MDIKKCIEQGFLERISVDTALVDKELAETDYDIEKASKAFDDEDYKWSIVKAYYAMFHAARAVLFKIGLREKRHFAIGIVLEDLSKKGKLQSRFVDLFSAAISSREDADYHYIYSEETAENSLKNAIEFIEEARNLLKRI